ncbi:MAG: prolipoprotein diacylglyceryl transferase [Candidatus Omnitrophica bacterium]|nr:prolipoprotein diacylglyceryl transferase [Candidatus Omnitrophota bacterium]MBU4473570.1 prolipoprotein diacylglyceryl transferase [Candidatus Omnitrophota bacterium]MCG2706287.1 prolipoprotein diacylglyceryl transferase [Candidatus Omnitrophota bacterium]
MYPIICKIGPFTVYSYGLMLSIAFGLSVVLAMAEARKQSIDTSIIFNFAFLVFVAGIIGARIFYIIENLGYYIKNPLEIIMLQYGGLSWFGGLFAGIIFGVAYLKKRNPLLYKILDLVVPFVALGQAIGRIGCLLNGCCFGKISRFGLYFPVHRLVLIPTQLYSSLLLIFIFLLLRFLQDRPHRQGQIFFLYLLLYSIVRFFIEFLRADNEVIFLELTLFQIISLVIFVLSSIKLFSIRPAKCGTH